MICILGLLDWPRARREKGRERESLNDGKEYINGETLSSISNVIQLLLLGTDPGIRQQALITPFFRAR